MSAQRRSGREISAAEARPLIGAHLRGRKDEIEQELLAQVDAFSRDDSVDPEYARGLRDSISIALEYGFQCIESSEMSAPPVPTPLYAQARLAARNGVELDTVLGRYFQGYTLLEAFVEDAAEAHGLVGSKALREIRRVSSALIGRLIDEIGEQYKDETRKLAASPESMRIKLVRQLLKGERIDTTQLNYEFGGFHVGLVAKGSGTAHAIKGLAKTLNCISLIVEPPRCSYLGLAGSANASRHRLHREIGVGTLANRIGPRDRRDRQGPRWLAPYAPPGEYRAPGKPQARWRLLPLRRRSRPGHASARPPLR